MHHAHIDKFAYQESPIHRLDSRVKLVITLVFTALVISLPRTSPAILACYAVGPFAVLVVGSVPLGFVLKHILLISPLIIVFALTSPIYDRSPVVVAFGPFSWQSTAGWMKCYTILAKFIVTMLALIGLISTTRFSELLAGLRKMKVPSVLVIQLGFLYRYIFVLIDIAHRILRARSGRKLRKLPFTAEVKTAGAMLGSLLIRSLDSAERINVAMRARGFDGRWRSISKLRIGAHDFAFIGICAAFMILVHFVVREVVS